MTPFEEKILAIGMKEVGAPYIWKAKGDCMWTLEGPKPVLVAIPNSPYGHAFDCSGFVNWCTFFAGGKDRRMVDNADSMFKAWEKVPSAASLESQPLAGFYGSGPNATHVSILLSMYGQIWALEAAGGDSTTVIPKPGAVVRCGPVLRRDLLGLRKLPAQ